MGEETSKLSQSLLKKTSDNTSKNKCGVKKIKIKDRGADIDINIDI